MLYLAGNRTQESLLPGFHCCILLNLNVPQLEQIVYFFVEQFTTAFFFKKRKILIIAEVLF